MPLSPSFTGQSYSVHDLRDLLSAYALLRCHVALIFELLTWVLCRLVACSVWLS